YLELGPGTTLIGLGKQDGGGEEAEWFSSLRRGKDDWSQTLESVAGVYEGGGGVDWERVDEADARGQGGLATYPVQRERYWTTARPVVAKSSAQPGDEWLYELKWESGALRHTRISTLPDAGPMIAKLREASSEWSAFDNPPLDAGFFFMIDRLSAAYAAQAIAGLDPEARIRPPYHRLRAMLVAISAEAPSENVPALLQEAIDRYPACQAELKLLAHCVAGIPGVLRAECSGPEVMFPGGDASIVENVYFRSPLAKVANRLVVETV